jgi:hypothetical protein
MSQVPGEDGWKQHRRDKMPGMMDMSLEEIKSMLGPGVSIKRKKRKMRKVSQRRRKSKGSGELQTEGGSYITTEGGQTIGVG